MLGIALVFRSFGRLVGRLVADPTSRGLGILAIGLITGGALFYRNFEDLSWIDSFYFTIVTLTTVGYGDIAPETYPGKVFTMLYLLIGVGVLVSFVTITARLMVEVREERVEARRERRSRRHDR
ncbi:MAG: potassium channel family protein [Acidimicrobiia bacterium]|nr:potassium channel family protein [Acidimicrobiia bacterium]